MFNCGTRRFGFKSSGYFWKKLPGKFRLQTHKKLELASFTVNYTSLELEFMALLALMKIAWLKTQKFWILQFNTNWDTHHISYVIPKHSKQHQQKITDSCKSLILSLKFVINGFRWVYLFNVCVWIVERISL